MDYTKKLEDLITILKDKKILFSEMTKLTKGQTDSISEDGVDMLTRLISEKEGILQQIIDLDDKFKSSYDSLKTELGVDSLEKSNDLPRYLLVELKKETKEILDMIHEISEIDKVNKKMAQELKDNLASEIKKINILKQTNGAYFGKSSYQGSYFIDSKK